MQQVTLDLPPSQVDRGIESARKMLRLKWGGDVARSFKCPRMANICLDDAFVYFFVSLG